MQFNSNNNNNCMLILFTHPNTPWQDVLICLIWTLYVIPGTVNAFFIIDIGPEKLILMIIIIINLYTLKYIMSRYARYEHLCDRINSGCQFLSPDDLIIIIIIIIKLVACLYAYTLFQIFSTFFSNNISFLERRNKRKSVLEITKMYYFKI